MLSGCQEIGRMNHPDLTRSIKFLHILSQLAVQVKRHWKKSKPGRMAVSKCAFDKRLLLLDEQRVYYQWEKKHWSCLFACKFSTPLGRRMPSHKIKPWTLTTKLFISSEKRDCLTVWKSDRQLQSWEKIFTQTTTIGRKSKSPWRQLTNTVI